MATPNHNPCGGDSAVFGKTSLASPSGSDVAITLPLPSLRHTTFGKMFFRSHLASETRGMSPRIITMGHPCEMSWDIPVRHHRMTVRHHGTTL